jgi:hypothetical protein
MRGRQQKIKQFGLCLGLMLSLFVSAFGACICSHHQEKAAAETASCHGHTAEADAESTNSGVSEDSAQTVNLTTISGGDCCCVQPATPKVFAKSETVNPEKQTAALYTANLLPLIVSFGRIFTLEGVLPKPAYLTDSFYNLTPGRAPPRL